MKSTKETFYRCAHCGVQFALLEPGHSAEPPLHCGAPMTRQQENSVDVSREKHVPVIRQDRHGVIVETGSTPHPMEETHFIEWIALSDGTQCWRRFLAPGEPPRAEFPAGICPEMTAVISCNLHGIWKSSEA